MQLCCRLKRCGRQLYRCSTKIKHNKYIYHYHRPIFIKSITSIRFQPNRFSQYQQYTYSKINNYNPFYRFNVNYCSSTPNAQSARTTISALLSLQNKVQKSDIKSDDANSGLFQNSVMEILVGLVSNPADVSTPELAEIVTGINDNWELFIDSKPDDVDTAVQMISLAGDIANAIPVAGAPISAVFSMVAWAIPVCYGKNAEEETMQAYGKMIQAIIKNALEEYKAEEVYETLITDIDILKDHLVYLVGFMKNGIILKDKGELNSLHSQQYLDSGKNAINILRSQIEKHHKLAGAPKQIALYIYYYCLINSLRRTALLYYYCILMANNQTHSAKGIEDVLKYAKSNDNETQKLLNFLERPSLNSTNVVYSAMHHNASLTLTSSQLYLVEQFRKQYGCKQFIGINCVLYNPKSGKYIDNNLYGYYTFYVGSTSDKPAQFRIFNGVDDQDSNLKKDYCYIFNISHSKFVAYLPEMIMDGGRCVVSYHVYNVNLPFVFEKSDRKNQVWIRNINHEYLYIHRKDGKVKFWTNAYSKDDECYFILKDLSKKEINIESYAYLFNS